MEEKVLIKSERYSLKILLIAILIIGALTTIIMFSSNSHIAYDSKTYDSMHKTYLEHKENGACTTEYGKTLDDKCDSCQTIEEYPIKLGYLIDNLPKPGTVFFFEDIIIPFIPLFVSVLISILVLLWLRSQELTVTDKRVYGKASFGKRVDLPLDSVSAVSTSAFKGIAVGTSSGKISFKLIKNQDEIHALVSKLLLERQKDEKPKTETQESNFTNADEIKKYKELLENGAITQEEFEAKKKQLLGL
ncbi:MAG: SHOCT domain-containing protein [Ruminococcus sp.]